jgi:endonuclease/exonuclease/phosphatase family metal-dependent hydrolase
MSDWLARWGQGKGTILPLLTGMLGLAWGGCGAGEAPVPEEVRALSFNLRTGFAEDGPNAWPERRDMLARLLERAAPDVLGVQEAWRFQLDFLAERVPGYAWVGLARSGVEQIDEYCAVFYRTDRFARVGDGTFWLSDTPDEPATRFSEAQNYPRIVTWAALRSLASDRVLYVFNTHFDTSQADEIPERSAALLVRRQAALAGLGPALVTGDFNQHVGSEAYRILTGEAAYEGARGRLVDPWAVLGLPEEGTYHRFTGVPTQPSRIDWVLGTEELVPRGGRVLHDQEDGRFPSDHFPVEATFAWVADGA